jgi:protein-tyrosine-phosphatase
MATQPHAGITVHLDAELDGIVQRLGDEFAGVASKEAIADVVQDSYTTIAKKAKVPTFIPVLTERFARQRLQAQAKADGSGVTVPTVLFLCVHNAGRSQMALGFLRHYAGDNAIAWSGGSEPGSEVNPTAVAVMAEKGIDISGEFPKPWTTEIVRGADVVITMGCGDTCPYYPGKRYEDWVLEDPAGQGPDAVRPIRDDIEQRVLALLESLGVEPNAQLP